MRLKFWQFEYDFDKDDAKIVIPTLLLIIAISTTDIASIYLIGLSVIYYLFYFFLKDVAQLIRKAIRAIPKPSLKCPHCKNHKIIMQGYQGYKSDELYAYYLCTNCKTTSILTPGGLLEI